MRKWAQMVYSAKNVETTWTMYTSKSCVKLLFSAFIAFELSASYTPKAHCDVWTGLSGWSLYMSYLAQVKTRGYFPLVFHKYQKHMNGSVSGYTIFIPFTVRIFCYLFTNGLGFRIYSETKYEILINPDSSLFSLLSVRHYALQKQNAEIGCSRPTSIKHYSWYAALEWKPQQLGGYSTLMSFINNS